MPGSPSDLLTRRETQIMQVLWECGQANADQIRQAMPDPLHDSTIRTVLRILEAKGCVRHVSAGRSYLYRPTVARSRVEHKAVRSLLKRFFGGSAEALVLRLIEDKVLTPEQLDELRQTPRKAGRPRGKGGTS